MSSSDSDHIDTAARALEAALARIGEPITEAQAREIAALEDCECKEGMFALATSRRAAGTRAGMLARLSAASILTTHLAASTASLRRPSPSWPENEAANSVRKEPRRRKGRRPATAVTTASPASDNFSGMRHSPSN